jgi:Mn-dependent DtxR family transcriptional regulator
MARYKFTQRLKKIIDQPVEKPHFDEIPINLRNELNLPQNLGDYEIDF